MQLQIILNKNDSLTRPVVIFTGDDSMQILSQDIEALENEHPEIFEIDDLLEQVNAFVRAGYEVTSVFTHSPAEPERTE